MIEIGTSIGRYHILEQLGQGGMATVYKAYDTRLERNVAIKVIRRNAFSPDILERVLKRFDREAKSLARLTHPNIVSIIDYGEYENSPYLVMPYLPGGTVKQFLGKPIACEKAIELLLPIADALRYSHQKGIVHRDVKPANILITEGGQPMLTDFGIARLLENEDAQTLTGTGVGVGTPEYMSPEQGIGKEVDGRSDIYSLGVVLYELVTGHKPYTADTPMAIVLKQATEPLPSPRKFVPELPEKVERVLFKALAKNPENRYPSMGDFARAMSGLTSNTSPSTADADDSLETSYSEMPFTGDETGEATFDQGAGTASPPQMARPIFPPSPEKPAVSPVTLAKVESQGSTGEVRKLSVEIPPEVSRTPGKKDTPAQTKTAKNPWLKWALAAIGVVIIGAIVWVLDSSKEPSATSKEVPTQEAAIILPTPVPSSEVLSDSNGNLMRRLENGSFSQLVFSADGKTIAAATLLGIFLYDAETLELIHFFDTGWWNDYVAISPDGSRLASGANDNTIPLWDVKSGALLQSFTETSYQIKTVAFSPDGRWLAAGGWDKTIKLYDTESGLLLQILEGHTDGVESVAFSPDGKWLASGAYDKTIRLWDVKSGALLQTLDGHNMGVLSVTFSPDGSRLASGSWDKTIKLWDAESGALLQTLEGHKNAVNSVAFSPDGSVLASGSNDDIIRLWDSESGTWMQNLEGHTGDVLSVAFSPDGRQLASGSKDGTIRIWEMANR